MPSKNTSQIQMTTIEQFDNHLITTSASWVFNSRRMRSQTPRSMMSHLSMMCTPGNGSIAGFRKQPQLFRVKSMHKIHWRHTRDQNCCTLTHKASVSLCNIHICTLPILNCEFGLINFDKWKATHQHTFYINSYNASGLIPPVLSSNSDHCACEWKKTNYSSDQ